MSRTYKREDNWYKIGAYPLKRYRTTKKTAVAIKNGKTYTRSLLTNWEQIVRVKIESSINCTDSCFTTPGIEVIPPNIKNPVGRIVEYKVNFDPVSHREVREMHTIEKVLEDWYPVGSAITVEGDIS